MKPDQKKKLAYECAFVILLVALFVLTRTTWFSPLCLVDLGKSMILSQVLERVIELSFYGMNFLLDSKIVIDTSNGGSIHNIEYGSIIQHCMQVFSNSFYNFMVKFS